MKAASTPPKLTAENDAREILAEEQKYLGSFQNLLLQTPVAIAIFRGSNYIVELANEKALGVIVKDNSFIGKPFFEAMPELENPLKEIFDTIMQNGILFQGDEMELMLYRNGKTETGWFNVSFQPIQEDSNSISGILASGNEVTDQVIARRKIEDSDKRYNMMLMNSPFGFAVLKGKNMMITLANDSIKTFWGKGKNLEGKSLFDVIPELKGSEFPDLLDKVYTTGIPFYGNELLAPILRNGKQEDVYFNFVYQPYLETDETISGVTVIAYEVTAQVMVKKALEAQREAEQKALKLVEETNKRYYSMLMDSPFAFSVMKGKDMEITLANDLIKEIWGKGNDVEGKTLLQVLPELKDQPFPAMLDKVYTTGIPVYANEMLARLQHEDKMKEQYFNIVYQPDHEADGTISGVITIAYDVTEMVLSRKKIEESDKRYNMMLMNSPFTFAVLKGKDLVIDLANDQIKEVWGRGNDIEGKSLLEIMPELKDTTFLDMLNQVGATGIPFHGIEVQSPKNMHGHVKEEYFFNFVFQPYLETDQTISGITIIGNEVTEQVIAKRKIEESEKKFKQLAELLPQKVWTADAEGNKTYFNQTLLDYAGMSSEELNGDKWKQMIHPDDWEQDEMKWKNSIKTGEIYQSESRFLRKDGKYLWHLTLAVPLKDETGKIVLWIGSKTEIEKQKKQKEILEEAVNGRTSELKQANEELIKMNKELEAFTYVSSHDLQEPLRKIRTIAGRILEKENQNLSDSGKNYFHLLQNAAERMQTLIQDLLAFSRLSMADRNFETTDLNIIIEEVKKEFKDAIAEKNAVIEVKEICDVKIIPFQFRQLMHNLISNALKYSNPKIPPHIKISSVNITYSKINDANVPPHKEYCHISISDNGIGFEKEFTEKIFEVFQKLHTKDEYAGTGIGLAIVKKIVENHNGVIFATSKLNIGTTFNIYIPA